MTWPSMISQSTSYQHRKRRGPEILGDGRRIDADYTISRQLHSGFHPRNSPLLHRMVMPGITTQMDYQPFPLQKQRVSTRRRTHRSSTTPRQQSICNPVQPGTESLYHAVCTTTNYLLSKDHADLISVDGLPHRPSLMHRLAVSYKLYSM